MENEVEIWKPVKGYEGRYEVSNLGRVKSLTHERTGNTIILKPSIYRHYYRVSLYDSNHNRKLIGIHRLVAEAFVPNPDNKPHVNHINELKTDNRACNLNWMTVTENNNHGSRTRKASLSMKGRHWYNNGEIEVNQKDCPEGFSRGRLKRL